jgi:hypothetical protein
MITHLTTELIHYQDNLYLLKRKIKESLNPKIDAWKEALGADTVLKKDEYLYFLEKIQDAQIIEEGEQIN